MFKKLILFLAILSLHAAPVSAADWTWKITGSGSWHTAANWNPASVPSAGSGNRVFVNNGGTVEIFNGNTVTANNIMLGDSVGGTGNMVIYKPNTHLTLSEIFIGNNGTSKLEIKDSGKLTSTYSTSIGKGVTGKGVIVIHNLAVWNATNVTIAYQGKGEAYIGDAYANGHAYANFTGTTVIGEVSGSTGYVSVKGYGSGISEWTTKAIRLGHSGTGTIDISAQGRLTSGDGVMLGVDTTGTGTVNLSNGGQWIANAGITVGNKGYGTLNITGGGYLDSRGIGLSGVSTDVVIGNEAPGTGIVNLQGSGSVWDAAGITVGNSSIGILNISNGAVLNANHITLAANAGSSATLNIGEGAGAGFINTPIITGGAGNAVVNFNYAGSPYYFTRLGVSNQDLSNAITLAGNLSVVNTAGYIILTGENTYIGPTIVNGGTLALNAGAQVTASSEVTVNASGTFSIANHYASSDAVIQALWGTGVVDLGTNTLVVGTGTNKSSTFSGTFAGAGTLIKDGTGTLTLLGATAANLNATIVHNGRLDVGAGSVLNAGTTTVSDTGTGTMNITDKGFVNSGNAYIGSAAGSVGVANITGAGSEWQTTGIYVGNAGKGTMNISDKGFVNSGNAYIGSAAGSVGIANITGSGSEWQTADISVGYNGSGTMNITGGGRANSGNAYIGSAAGSVGVANITGSGSEWQTTGISVGYDGSGTLNITGGGRANSGNTVIGNAAGSVGVANITGAGSEWQTAGISVGYDGTGTMNITGGGRVVSPGSGSASIFIGRGATGDGLVTISGAGSVWDTTPNGIYRDPSLAIGPAGRGRMVVTDGGKYDSTMLITLAGSTAASRGWLDVDAGILRAADVRAGSDGIGKFNILGSGSDILLTGGFNSTGTPLDTWFYADSSADGTSAVNVAAGTVNLADGSFHFAGYGFAAQNSANTFDLFTAPGSSYTGTLSVPLMKVVSNYTSTGKLTIAFNENELPVWDLDSEKFYFPTTNRKYDGWVEVTGTPLPDLDILVRFDLGNSEPTYDLMRTLQNYLNNGLNETNHVLTLYRTGMASDSFYVDFFLSSEILLGGYNVLGWGLDHFNDLYGTNVSLLFCAHVPEPGTYTMLIIGAGIIFCFHRHNPPAQPRRHNP